MRIFPVALLALTGLSFSFQDFRGFRYGSGMGLPWATARRNGTIFVAGNLADSACCSWDSMASSPDSFYPYTAWLGAFDTAGNSVASQRLWAKSPSRWFGMEVDSSGVATTVGMIQDTVFFEGKKRITAQGIVKDSVSSDGFVGSQELLRLGGGGGIGVARWSRDGARQWLQLFRTTDGFESTISTGWDVHVRPSGGLSLSGSFSLTDSEPVLCGNDTVARLPSGTSIVLAGMRTDGSGAWLHRGFTGFYASHPAHTWTSQGLWLVQGDSVAPLSGPSGWQGSRPILVRYDTTGKELEQIHPLGDMRGGFLAIASREDGALLLQGEQASDLSWNGTTVSPVWDSIQGRTTIPCSSFLLLLDSLGHPQRFRSLSGIGYVGSWKICRVAGKGWLLLGWDQHDVAGFSRLFLLDDSLNVQEMSDSLPPTLDIDLDALGNITLSGYLWSTTMVPAWLSGSGTQWNATCRFGKKNATTGLATGRKMTSSLTSEREQVVVHLESGETGVLELRLVDGQLLERRYVVDGARCVLPLGASIVRLCFPSGEITGKFVRP